MADIKVIDTRNSDLSPRVVQLARIIDRLPPGEFEIHLCKSQDKAVGWEVSIIQPVTIRQVVLNKPSLKLENPHVKEEDLIDPPPPDQSV